MRFLLVILLIFLGQLPAIAADPARDPQTAAALADAQEALRREVMAANVARGVSVRDVLDKTGGADELSKQLQSAQQVGGARWLDDQTVQVRLVIDGAPLARSLMGIVEREAGKSPVPPEAVRRGLDKWRGRTFSATGTSTGSRDIERIGPPASNLAWAGVSDADRNRALASARDNAVAHVVDSLRQIELKNGQTLDAALAAPEVGGALAGWVGGRPLTSVEFRDDRSVRVTLATPADELWQVLKDALVRQKGANLPPDTAGWDALRRQVVSRVAPAVGVGLVQARNDAPRADDSIPAIAPEWATRQLQAEATAPGKGSKLQTARAAQTAAMEQLRHQAEALKLRGDVTVGEAAARNPRVAQALAKALDRARPYQVDYLAQGQVTVHVAMSLGDLWSLLEAR